LSSDIAVSNLYNFCSTFNDGGATLTLEQKTILPRRRRLELLQKEPIPEDYCTICFAQPGDTVLTPCMHG
ncbi:hypothetical protein OESDEN_18950, partial [Oesophagostomum dentatum]